MADKTDTKAEAPSVIINQLMVNHVAGTCHAQAAIGESRIDIIINAADLSGDPKASTAAVLNKIAAALTAI